LMYPKPPHPLSRLISICNMVERKRDYCMFPFAFDLPKAPPAAIASDGFFVCPQIGASSICFQTKKPPSYR
jgi:hypothetical protein